jgi:hypothetical protein
VAKNKVVGLEKMHIYANDGVMICKFSMDLGVTKLNWIKSQVKSYIAPIVVYFFLGTTSHIMTSCAGF